MSDFTMFVFMCIVKGSAEKSFRFILSCPGYGIDFQEFDGTWVMPTRGFNVWW